MNDDVNNLDDATAIRIEGIEGEQQFQDALEHRHSSDLENYLPASFMARAGAHLVDTMLFTGVISFTADLIGLASGANGSWISWFVSAILLSFFLSRDGQTPGKKLFKLKAVTFEDGSPVNMKTALKRELIGRLVLMLTLGLGYLMTIFRGDKRSLHDLVGGTTVLDLECHEQVPVRTKMLRLATPVLGLFAFVALKAGLMLFSTEPLREIAVALESKGFQVDGLQGSLATGFRAEAIRRSDDEMDFNMTNLVVHYNLLSTLQEGRHVFNEISADKIHLELKGNDLFAEKEKPAATETEVPPAPTEEKKDGKAEMGLFLRDLHVNSVFLKQGERKFQLGETRVTNLSLDKNTGFSLERFELDSAPLKIQTGTIAIQMKPELQVRLQDLNLIVRPDVAPNYLSAPVDVSGQLDFVFDTENKKVRKLEVGIKALGDRFQVSRDEKTLLISLKDWEPSEHIKGIGSFKIEEISWSIPGDELDFAQLTALALMQPPKVRIKMGERIFANTQMPTVLVSDDNRIKLIPQLKNFFTRPEDDVHARQWTLAHTDDREYSETNPEADFLALELFGLDWKHSEESARSKASALLSQVSIEPVPSGSWERDRFLEDDLTLSREAALAATAQKPPRSIVVRQTMAAMMKCSEDAVDAGEALIEGPTARAKDQALKPKVMALLARCQTSGKESLRLLSEAHKMRPDDPLIMAFLAHAMMRNDQQRLAEKTAVTALENPNAGRIAQAWSLKLLMDNAEKAKNKKLLAKWQKVLQERQAVWRAPASTPPVEGNSERNSQNEAPKTADEGQGSSDENR